MKKQLLIAAVAATMSAAAFADISIKGDSHFQYANIDNDSAFDGFGNTPAGETSNANEQRVRLHITGTSGDTTLNLGLRNDGRTRAANGQPASEGSRAFSSGAGLAGDNSSQFNTDYLFLTTKIGALHIKAGDWWDTTGFGVARKAKADADRIEFSTKLAGWKLGFETGVDSSSSVFSAHGKIGGFNVSVEHNTAVSVEADPTIAIEAYVSDNTNTGIGMMGSTTAEIAAIRVEAAGVSNGFAAIHDGDYTDVAVKGKIGPVGVAAEYFAGTNDTRGDIAGLNDDADAALVHFWTKAADITWHVAWVKADGGVAGITGNGNKFAAFGVSILGTAPGGNGAAAIGNFGDNDDRAWGVRADVKVVGMDLQLAAGELSVANKAFDDTFWDVILTRPLGKGSKIRFSAGEWNDVTSIASKISVKF